MDAPVSNAAASSATVQRTRTEWPLRSRGSDAWGRLQRERADTVSSEERAPGEKFVMISVRSRRYTPRTYPSRVDGRGGFTQPAARLRLQTAATMPHTVITPLYCTRNYDYITVRVEGTVRGTRYKKLSQKLPRPPLPPQP